MKLISVESDIGNVSLQKFVNFIAFTNEFTFLVMTNARMRTVRRIEFSFKLWKIVINVFWCVEWKWKASLHFPNDTIIIMLSNSQSDFGIELSFRFCCGIFP
jgi:hypothetical protein